jgi:hypothetical protein
MAESPDSEGNLTGYWSGSFSYVGGEGPTPFSAHISDISGSISGTTLEPNTFAKGPLKELSADIMGAANGHSVSFVKRYHRGPGVHRNPIYYSGTTDAKFTRIEGTWRFNNGFSGTFVMIRASGGAKAVAKEREEAVPRAPKR